MEDKLLTIDQASQLLGVSKDTVRRRIKAGELQAEKHAGPYGEQWMLPDFQFTQARLVQDVVPVTRQVTVAELQGAMQMVINETVHQAVKEETIALREEVLSLKEQLEATQNSLDGHFKLVDNRLRQIVEQPKQRSFWSRLFG